MKKEKIYKIVSFLPLYNFMVALTEALSNPSRPVRRLLDMALTWENTPTHEVSPPPACRTFRQLRPHEVDELVSLFDPTNGVGVKELATKFGIHRSTVGKFLKERGIETRPTLKPEDIPTAAALYRSGLTLAQVAQRYGIAKDTVRLKLIEAGVTMRSSWKSRRD